MLATLTVDGDLRVWSVPKGSSTEQPSIIRVLSRSDAKVTGPGWFAWSKMGRIVQHQDGYVPNETTVSSSERSSKSNEVLQTNLRLGRAYEARDIRSGAYNRRPDGYLELWAYRVAFYPRPQLHGAAVRPKPKRHANAGTARAARPCQYPAVAS